jgi:serine/threonine protein phosphatase PrpC
MAAAPLDEASRVTLEAWLVTDVGVVREHNEDSAYMEPTNGFFIVADGMGGHAAGEVASAMAVDTVRKTLEEARRDIDTFKRAPTDAGRRGIVQLLQSAVLSAHQAVFQRGQHEADKAGMGTTLDVVLIAGPEAFVAHVGDSRTYLVRDGRSSQITTDHTVAEVLVIEGKLTIEEAQVSPLRTILVNAIGVSADVGVEMAHVTLKRGDRMLLCSDGLHDYFPSEDEIAQKLSTAAPGDALKDMVELAKTRGGHDNITGVAVQVTEVIEAVPGPLDSDLTQPVDASGTNPFAADEPTETALVEPTGITSGAPTRPAAPAPPLSVTPPAMTPSQLKATQPMRIVEDGDDVDAAIADTLPPPEPPKLDPPPEVPPRPATADGGTPGAKADAAPGEESSATPNARAAGPGGKPDGKAGATPGEPSSARPEDAAAMDDKTDTTVEVDPVAPGPAAATPISDGAKPAEPDAEHPAADTGRVIPGPGRASKDKDAG